MNRNFLCFVLAVLLVGCLTPVEEGGAPAVRPKAKNVILIVGDGVGIPTLNAASLFGYGRPLSLFVQQMPHSGLSDTSAANSWVSDSAAGMTAIMTGTKTNNGVVSLGPDTVRGKRDGQILKTLLELAEERGLATGVVSNSSMADATPAACYAHANDRKKTGEIFRQLFESPSGDGVDVVIGPGREEILEAMEELEINLSSALADAGYTFVASETEMLEAAAGTQRLVALYPDDEYDLATSADSAFEILSRDPDGFFLMVESNNHSEDVADTLSGTVAMDQMIRSLAERVGPETLVVFAADHSYAYRIPEGGPGEDVVGLVTVEDTHTAEEVLVAAQGPGSEAVRGLFPNTKLFSIMKEAYGW